MLGAKEPTEQEVKYPVTKVTWVENSGTGIFERLLCGRVGLKSGIVGMMMMMVVVVTTMMMMVVVVTTTMMMAVVVLMVKVVVAHCCELWMVRFISGRNPEGSAEQEVKYPVTKVTWVENGKWNSSPPSIESSQA